MATGKLVPGVPMEDQIKKVKEDLGDLQKRFHLLEGDRQAFYEASSWTIKQNKETLERLKKQNKELRQEVAAVNSTRSTTSGDRLGIELERGMLLVQTLRKEFDDAKATTKARETQLNKLQDGLRDIARESPTTAEDTSPVGTTIRTLENKLDKAMIKYNEAQSIRKTYEQIAQRLQEERLNFDNQLAAVESTLKARQHDYEELLMMSHDARHAKQVAETDLADLELEVKDVRESRERELLEHEMLLKQQTEREERERQSGILTPSVPAEEARAPTQPAAIDEQVEQQQKKITSHEEAFRRIKEATGVADVNEVITKFLTQEETYQNLLQLQQEAQATIDRLQNEKKELKAKLEELKYSGQGTLGNRRVVDDFEQHLAVATASCERNRVKSERLTKILVNVKAGIQHLYEKLEIVDINELRLSTDAKDDSILEMLMHSERKLMKVLTQLGPEADALDSPHKAAMSARSTEMQKYNIRIRLPEDEGEAGRSDTPGTNTTSASPIPGSRSASKLGTSMMGDVNESGDESSDGDEPLDRKQIKDRAQAVLQSLSGKKKTKRRTAGSPTGARSSGGKADMD